MSFYAIGDIHGCLNALKVLLQSLDLKAEDTLLFLGDYIDRGPASYGVLDYLSLYKPVCKKITLLGNHELLLLQAREKASQDQVWMIADGKRTPKAFRLQKNDFLDFVLLQKRHWDFLEACPFFFETEDFIFSHAPLHPERPLQEHGQKELCWNSMLPKKAHLSQKLNIFGHIPQETGLPLDLGYAIALDTAVCEEGFLSCLNVSTKELWQSKETGELRKLKL